MMNSLICWEENGIQKWEVVKKNDCNTFLFDLMYDDDVNKRSIFITPLNQIFSSIWLFPETHKSNRVDYFNFHEDFGVVYEPPKVNEEIQKMIDEYEDKHGDKTKYGWISRTC